MITVVRRGKTNAMAASEGFWGPIDSLHTFCEVSYKTTYYVAEPYNALGSLIYVIAAHIHLHKLGSIGRPVAWQLKFAVYSLLVVGWGSFLFHATMRYHMELLDEIPMIMFVGSGCFLIDGCHPWFKSQKEGRSLVLGSVVLNTLCIALYLLTGSFAFFITAFTANTVVLLALVTTAGLELDALKHLVTRSAFMIIMARVAWEVENHACKSYPWLWPLHNVWHLLSAWAAYDLISTGCEPC